MGDPATVYLTGNDVSHEATVANVMQAHAQAHGVTLEFHPTPKFFPFDFHVMRTYGRGSSDYWGGLEVKWFTHGSDQAGVFNYNKALQLLAMTVHRDDPNCHQRVAFRFTDGILITKAATVATQTPQVFTRRDTSETDLVVRISPACVPGTWIEVQT